VFCEPALRSLFISKDPALDYHEQKMALSGAYRGYLHQDAVTAYLLATLLFPAPAQELFPLKKELRQTTALTILNCAA
jgi:hypothetical protein